MSPWGGTDLRFLLPSFGHQPKPSRKTTDTGPVLHVVCPFTPQISLGITVGVFICMHLFLNILIVF